MKEKSARFTIQSPLISPATIIEHGSDPKNDLLA